MALTPLPRHSDTSALNAIYKKYDSKTRFIEDKDLPEGTDIDGAIDRLKTKSNTLKELVQTIVEEVNINTIQEKDKINILNKIKNLSGVILEEAEQQIKLTEPEPLKRSLKVFKLSLSSKSVEKALINPEKYMKHSQDKKEIQDSAKEAYETVFKHFFIKPK